MRLARRSVLTSVSNMTSDTFTWVMADPIAGAEFGLADPHAEVTSPTHASIATTFIAPFCDTIASFVDIKRQ